MHVIPNNVELLGGSTCNLFGHDNVNSTSDTVRTTCTYTMSEFCCETSLLSRYMIVSILHDSGYSNSSTQVEMLVALMPILVKKDFSTS
jgi:hypothetical protein